MAPLFLGREMCSERSPTFEPGHDAGWWTRSRQHMELMGLGRSDTRQLSIAYYISAGWGMTCSPPDPWKRQDQLRYIVGRRSGTIDVAPTAREAALNTMASWSAADVLKNLLSSESLPGLTRAWAEKLAMIASTRLGHRPNHLAKGSVSFRDRM